MKRFALFATSVLFAVACTDSTSPPVATTIVLSTSAVSFDAIGATQVVTAVVNDQRGQPMKGAPVVWTTSTAAASVVASSQSGSATITSALNGPAIVTATAGSAHATISVSVAQVPAALQKVSGDAQASAVNSLLPAAIVVRVVDRMGAPMAGQSVAFAVTQGGGAVSQQTVLTSGDGTALTGWTLGKVASEAHQATATIGALSPVSFTATAVAGAPAKVTVVAGDNQTATVGSTLPVTPQVVVTDAYSNVVENAMVSFTTTSGQVSSTSAATNRSGIATPGSWRLGTAAGTKTLTASIPGVPAATISATATPGPAADLIISGNNQTAAAGSTVLNRPSVKVVDVFDNAIQGVTVVFAVASGGGTITGATQTTNASGIATVGGWTLGPVVGANTLTVSLPAITTIAARTITATATASSGGTGGGTGTLTMTAASGDNQAVMAGQLVTALPSVVVRDSLGAPVAGIPVTFSVRDGGGTVTGGTTTTNASGVATPASWRIGGVAALNTLAATAANVGTLVFSVAGCEGSGAGYTITVCYRTFMTPAQRQAFVDAAARWKSVITSDLTDVPATISTGQCDGNSPSLNLTIDDLLIFAAIEPIDGAGQVLGSAGWCFRRSAGLPVIGTMRFDAADVAGLESTNRLGAVILHEMGHVIGVGSMWTLKSLLQNPSIGSAATDTYFSGTNAIAAFDAIGGATYTGGLKVPVENTGGIGTMNAHWRETVLANELMTGFLNNGSNPLSLVTVRSLEDLGYTVNTAAADPFSLTLSLRASLAPEDPFGIRIENDAYLGRQSTISPTGRITRIR